MAIEGEAQCALGLGGVARALIRQVERLPILYQSLERECVPRGLLLRRCGRGFSLDGRVTALRNLPKDRPNRVARIGEGNAVTTAERNSPLRAAWRRVLSEERLSAARCHAHGEAPLFVVEEKSVLPRRRTGKLVDASERELHADLLRTCADLGLIRLMSY
nr:hypothetical protein [Methylosinus sp. R-45379]